MSADMMIICKEDRSSYEGDGTDKAFQIDETSLGEPLTEFGKWFGARYCGAPGILEQLSGIKEHSYKKLSKPDVVGIMAAFNSMPHREGIAKKDLEKFLLDRIGKSISTENW